MLNGRGNRPLLEQQFAQAVMGFGIVGLAVDHLLEQLDCRLGFLALEPHESQVILRLRIAGVAVQFELKLLFRALQIAPAEREHAQPEMRRFDLWI